MKEYSYIDAQSGIPTLVGLVESRTQAYFLFLCVGGSGNEPGYEARAWV